MPTMRTRVSPAKRLRITPAAVAAFRIMERARLRCTCKDSDNAYSCPACRRWWRAHGVLSELKMPPWRFPCIEWRGERAERREAFELYTKLVKAAAPHSAASKN